MENKNFEERVLERLYMLEQHFIHFITPLQGIHNLFIDEGSLSKLINVLQKPLEINDKNMMNILNSFQIMTYEFKNLIDKFYETIKLLDVYQTYGEIKYIGKRLNHIEEILRTIQKDGIKKNVQLSLSCTEYEMVKTSIEHENRESYENDLDNLKKLLNTLTERESTCLIHRFGLFGEIPKSYENIGKTLKRSGTRIRINVLKALKKCRHPSRKLLVEKIFHEELKKAILNDKY